jgi:hypothetical protein
VFADNEVVSLADEQDVDEQLLALAETAAAEPVAG